jgi:hypothetical protein
MTHLGSYESGMRLIYHPTTKTLSISFRGKIYHIGPFETHREAVLSGEEHCRRLGWNSHKS